MAQEGQSEAVSLDYAKTLLAKLDGGGELGVGELGRIAVFADEVDRLYGERGIEGVWWEVEVQPLKLLVRALPEGLTLISACGDGGWRKVGEVLVGEGFVIAWNRSLFAITEAATTAGAEAALEVLRALGGDEAYDCIAFWLVGSRTEVLKCVSADRDLYLVVAPHVVYSLRRAGGKTEAAVVRDRDAVRAIHVMLNTPY